MEPAAIPVPVCSNCGASDFVWADNLKTGTIGRGTLSLRSGGELALGTRVCRGCGHADLFLKDMNVLRQPHTWRPGEFVPIPSRPAPAPAPAAAPAPIVPASPPPPPPAPSAPALEPAPAPVVAPAPEEGTDPAPASPSSEGPKSDAPKRGGRRRSAKGRSATPSVIHD